MLLMRSFCWSMLPHNSSWWTRFIGQSSIKTMVFLWVTPTIYSVGIVKLLHWHWFWAPLPILWNMMPALQNISIKHIICSGFDQLRVGNHLWHGFNMPHVYWSYLVSQKRNTCAIHLLASWSCIQVWFIIGLLWPMGNLDQVGSNLPASELLALDCNACKMDQT